MANVSFMGSYSGITMDTVDQLIQAESGKLVQYTNQQSELTVEKNAWKDVNTRLDSLMKKFDAMKAPETFDSKTISNSNESVATVSAGTAAIEGTYQLHVENLATSSQFTSGKIGKLAGDDKTIESDLGLTGQLTLTSKDKTTAENESTFTIGIEEGDSLKDVVNKINELSKDADSGLQATIIDERLVISDSNMGAREITVEGDANVMDALSLNKDGTGDSAVSFVSGDAARFTINGIEIERNTNTITDAVDGLTFTLNAPSPTEATSTITIAEDHEKTVESVQAFVDQYNSVISFIDTQLDVGDPSAEGNTTGALVGDSAVMRLQSQLRSMMTSVSDDPNQTIRSVADLGIEVDRYGQATLNTDKLNEVLAEDSNAVQDFFFREEPVLDEAGNETGKTKEVGMAQQMTSFINEYIAEETGIIATKATTIDGMIEDLDNQITKFNERLEVKRERYIEQFTALDIAMMEAESQLNYLTSQIGASTEQA